MLVYVFSLFLKKFGFTEQLAVQHHSLVPCQHSEDFFFKLSEGKRSQERRILPSVSSAWFSPSIYLYITGEEDE